MPLDAKHLDGSIQLDTHSLYGTYEVMATHNWFKKQNKRTMIIERSAFAGAGKFASRWLGDNWSSQEYMGYSVTGIMQHNLIGIPLAGSDICGFIGDTSPELCARWYTLGAFYPFSRNHNSWNSAPQEPWVFADQIYDLAITYMEIMKKAMYTKHHLVRYYYTELTMLAREGGTFFKPLFMEFPDDDGALNAPQELNIMIGEAAKLSINSNKLGKDTTGFYFPAGYWCDLLRKKGTETCFKSAGETKTMSSKAYDAHLQLREGYIMPMQDGTKLGEDETKVRNIKGLQAHPVDMHLLPKCEAGKCTAAGRYLNDDGEVLDQTGNVNIYTLDFSYDGSEGVEPAAMTFTVTQAAKATKAPNNIVNENDVLQSLHINNGAVLKFATAYTVTVTKADDTTVTYADATYDAMWDRLTFTNTDLEKKIELPNIKKIDLAKK